MILEDMQFVVPDAIVRDLAADSKRAAIESLVTQLSAAGRLSSDSVASVTSAILKREELGSTGIGRGLAVPHAKHEGVHEPIAAIGYVPQGIDFDALDGAKVHTIVLMVSPVDRPQDHLRALERISQLLQISPE